MTVFAGYGFFTYFKGVSYDTAIQRIKDLEIPYEHHGLDRIGIVQNWDDDENYENEDNSDVNGVTVVDLGGTKRRKHLFIGKIFSVMTDTVSSSIVFDNLADSYEWINEWSGHLALIKDEFKGAIDDVDGSALGLRIVRYPIDSDDM